MDSSLTLSQHVPSSRSRWEDWDRVFMPADRKNRLWNSECPTMQRICTEDPSQRSLIRPQVWTPQSQVASPVSRPLGRHPSLALGGAANILISETLQQARVLSANGLTINQLSALSLLSVHGHAKVRGFACTLTCDAYGIPVLPFSAGPGRVHTVPDLIGHDISRWVASGLLTAGCRSFTLVQEHSWRARNTLGARNSWTQRSTREVEK